MSTDRPSGSRCSSFFIRLRLLTAHGQGFARSIGHGWLASWLVGISDKVLPEHLEFEGLNRRLTDSGGSR